MLARYLYIPIHMRTCLWMIAGLLVAAPVWSDDLLDGLSDPTRPSSRGAASEGVSRGGLVLQSTQSETAAPHQQAPTT